MLKAIKNRYELVIALCCFLILFTNIGLASTSFSVYQPYLVAIPGVGHSGGSIILSVRTFVSLIAMFFVARYYAWLNCRLGVLIASLCVAAGFALYAINSSNYLGLCAGSVFTGLGYGLGGMIASTMLISRWFESSVATVAGFAAVGSGVAAVVLPSIVVGIVNASGLASAFAFEAVLAVAMGVLVFALLRNFPEDMGLKPYSGSEKSKRGKPRKQQKRVSRNVPHKVMPLVLMAMVFVGCISVGGTSYIAVLFTSEGFTTEAAAALVALNGGCLAVAKLVSGLVLNRAGTRNGSALFFALFIAGTALLCATALGATGLAPVAVVLYSIGLTLGSVGVSVWSIELSPHGHEVQTIKNFQICYALGGFVFTFLPGFLTEAFGTYLVSYVALLVMITLAGIIIIGVYTATDLRKRKA